MKCAKCGSNKMEWSPVANGIAVCRNCWCQGVPDLHPQTNFEKMTTSPEALAKEMVFETIKGVWRYRIGEKISVQAFRSREEAERGAVEYLKHRYEQGWLDWLNSPVESEG